ncbi:uncharacterized protein LOC112904785 [Agrilus planipennis]|uniref:Uncharacterized protein LOC112904785 n=1 Tax=Agrilus planipennis TaxID=224129 RepID=A0A7F5R6D3_AGRPL|nr:uncharacterized protein LOC112904785 [Agrilus planipennis]
MATGHSDTAQTDISIDRVTVKVPQFIAADPELWFSILESSFVASGITQDSTKFGYAVSGLDQKYAVEVRDIILKPRNERSYEMLKTELIKRMGSSREHNTRPLLENEPLGDRKPTQFLRHLRNLAGNEFPEDILQTLWVSRLPKLVQAILVGHKDLTLDKRAEIADSIIEAYGTFNNIAEMSSTPTESAINNRFDLLENALTSALQEIAAIKINSAAPYQYRRSRRPSRSSSRSSTSRSVSCSRSDRESAIPVTHRETTWAVVDDGRRPQPYVITPFVRR